MAAGYDISASASSAIDQALSYAVHADIVFGNAGSSGIEQAPRSGDATSVAARSQQGDVANAQPDGATYTDTAQGLLASAGIQVPAASSSSLLLYGIIGGVLLIVLFIFKRK